MSEKFKDISELEEFFKNLGIEYRFSCYYENNAEGCHLLGDYMTAIQEDVIRSAKVYKDNCNNNRFARSCTEFGKSLFYGKGCERDLQKAVQYFSKGCDLGDNEGCFTAGQLLSGADPQYKDIVKPNIKKSVEYLEKGCEMTKNGSIAAECCFYAHSFYLFGKNGCEKNLEKAFKYAVKGCEFDNLETCNNLSQMYSLGMGTQKDELMAKKYKNKSIDMMEQLRHQSSIQTQRT